MVGNMPADIDPPARHFSQSRAPAPRNIFFSRSASLSRAHGDQGSAPGPVSATAAVSLIDLDAGDGSGLPSIQLDQGVWPSRGRLPDGLVIEG